MSAPTPSQLDGNQVLQGAFDDATGKLRVDATVSAVIGDVKITDNDGDDLQINPDGSLNVSLTGSTAIEIDAADGDNIAISDGTNTASVNPDGSLNATVTATDLDIRNLSFANDKVDVSGSTIALDATTLSALENTSVTVTNLSGASAVNIQDGGNSITVDGTVAATQSGTWNVNNISGTVSLPTGASTAANQTTGNTSLSSIDTKLTTTNSSLSSIDAGIPAALGQTTMANSMPVAIASDQTVIPINDNGGSLTVDGTVAATQSGTWNINNVSGTVSLPTGAATETTLGTRLSDSTFTTRINTQGQKAMSASTPVVIASDQSTLNVKESSFSTMTQTGPTVTNASSTVLASNSNRRYVMIYNQSGSTIYLSFGATAAVIGTGIRLANNSSYEITSDNLFTGAITAIKSGAAGVVLDIIEGT